MGHNRRFRSLEDAARYGANFALICRACRREVIVERRTFIEMMDAIGAGADPAAIGFRLRCTACRHRGGIVELAPADTPNLLKLHDGDALPPKGMSVTQWLKMSNEERKRYRRALR